jgi:CRP-like cAMP-binding protein
MAKSADSPGKFRNSILSSVSSPQREAIARHLQPIELVVRQNIYLPDETIRWVYFVEAGMISVVSKMSGGRSIEVGTVGREGMAGAVLLLGADAVPYHHYVQLPGHGYRMDADAIKEAAERNVELRDRILRYQAAFLVQSMQTAACNGLHAIIQRCCRWILLSMDRSESDKIPLTHEFLALMLGVRRASVSEVLQPLQERGWIQSNRGEITVLSRAGLESGSCECYGLIAAQFNRLSQ